MKNTKVMDKKMILREESHLTRPPRLEGVVKNAMMYSPPKKKKAKIVYTSNPGIIEDISGVSIGEILEPEEEPE